MTGQSGPIWMRKVKFKRFRCHFPITIITPTHADDRGRQSKRVFTANIAFKIQLPFKAFEDGHDIWRENLKGILFIVMAIENDNSSIFSGTRGAASFRHAIYSVDVTVLQHFTNYPEKTLENISSSLCCNDVLLQ